MNSASGPLPVSIIIPTYNRAHLVGRAIQSALQQIQAGDEVIVVDDGSTDSTEEALKPFRDRIVYIRKENGGAGKARNRGIRQAKAPLIAFLDSDDEWLPGKLELQRRFMQARPDVLISFSDFIAKTESGQIVHKSLLYWHEDPRSWNEILAEGAPYSSITSLPPGFQDFQVHCGSMYVPMASRIYIYTSTVVVRREEAGDALRFEEDIPLYEDWICYARVAQKGMAAFLDAETACQHKHSAYRLTDAEERVRIETRVKIMKRLWGSDPEFLRQHGDLYNSILSQRYLRSAELLLSQGQTKQARAELQLIKNAPLTHRLMAALPGSVVRGLVNLRRTVRGSRRV